MKSWFDKLPNAGTCGLRIEGPNIANTIDAAWALLPETGEGWIALTDRVRRFEPGWREGLLLYAEVVEGPRTLVVRHDDGRWLAWSWEETAGDDHRVVRRRYLSSAQMREGSPLPEMEYAAYWEQRDDDGLLVWQPKGSRLIGWKEGS